MATAAQVRIDEPEEKLFRIGEVSRLTGTKAFVLRYWEQEIPTLQPVKTPTGHRLYRREDIETIFEIKRLLYEQGFTLAGARKHLSEAAAQARALESAGGNATGTGAVAGTLAGSGLSDARIAGAPAFRPVKLSKARQKVLLDLHEELLAILTLLKRE
jgi:DNA-binding transcriptional MerR regulator